MLKRWQLTCLDLANYPTHTRVRENICLNEGDTLRRPNVLGEFGGGILVSDNG